MNACHDAFYKRKSPEEGGIHEDRHEQDSPRQQRCLPPSRLVAVIAKGNQGGDLLCRGLRRQLSQNPYRLEYTYKAGCRKTRLPAQHAKEADAERENLLINSWCN